MPFRSIGWRIRSHRRAIRLVSSSLKSPILSRLNPRTSTLLKRLSSLRRLRPISYRTRLKLKRWSRLKGRGLLIKNMLGHFDTRLPLLNQLEFKNRSIVFRNLLLFFRTLILSFPSLTLSFTNRPLLFKNRQLLFRSLTLSFTNRPLLFKSRLLLFTSLILSFTNRPLLFKNRQLLFRSIMLSSTSRLLCTSRLLFKNLMFL